jgi:hypothetical protein
VLEIRGTECLLFPIEDVQAWSRVGAAPSKRAVRERLFLIFVV